MENIALSSRNIGSYIDKIAASLSQEDIVLVGKSVLDKVQDVKRLYILAPQTSDPLSIAEVALEAEKNPVGMMILLVQQDDNDIFDRKQWGSLMELSKLMEGYGVQTFTNPKDIAAVINHENLNAFTEEIEDLRNYVTKLENFKYDTLLDAYMTSEERLDLEIKSSTLADTLKRVDKGEYVGKGEELDRILEEASLTVKKFETIKDFDGEDNNNEAAKIDHFIDQHGIKAQTTRGKSTQVVTASSVSNEIFRIALKERGHDKPISKNQAREIVDENRQRAGSKGKQNNKRMDI